MLIFINKHSSEYLFYYNMPFNGCHCLCWKVFNSLSSCLRATDTLGPVNCFMKVWTWLPYFSLSVAIWDRYILFLYFEQKSACSQVGTEDRCFSADVLLPGRTAEMTTEPL